MRSSSLPLAAPGRSEATSADDVPFDLASARARLAAEPETADWQLDFVAETGSTNADLLAWLAASVPSDPLRALPEGPARILVAGAQHAGRGRQGRPWQSRPGDGLLCSTALVLRAPLAGLSSLSLVAGAALVTALRTLPLAAPRRIALKWPNDVLLDGRKLAGILIELAATRDGRAALVIGVGVNLRAVPADGLPTNVDGTTGTAPPRQPLPRASLDELIDEAPAGTPDLASQLLAVWAVELAKAIRLFERAGFAPFREVWWRNHAYANHAVTLFEQGRALLSGKAVGIDETGRLLIDDGATVQAVSSGDLSLRLATQP